MKTIHKFMRLHHVILFFCATASLNAVAQSELPDTLDISHELDEIVVTAPENHTIGNKTLFGSSRNSGAFVKIRELKC